MSKYGGAVHAYVDKHSKEGVVYVKGLTREAAMMATKAIHGRYFDGKMIQGIGATLDLSDSISNRL